MLLETNSILQTKTEIDIINNVGFPIWIEDASLLYNELCKISKNYNGTISQFLERNPQELPRLIDLIKIIDVNDETVKMYKAQHKKELLQGIRNFFIKESYQDFIKMIVSLFSGLHEYTYTSSKITIRGCKIITQVKVKIPETAIGNWSKMIVSEVEISQFIKREVTLKMQADKSKQDAENKEKILSIIAHDLKNPFNTILGFSELLLSKYNTISEEQAQEFITYIHESAHQSYHLLTNLLHWSKMQQSNAIKPLQKIPLHPLVSSVSELIHMSCVSKNIKIHQNISEEIEVCADVHMLSFILRNLLTNAIKFSYKNSDIFISAYSENFQTVVEISDKGIGMDLSTQLSLFDPEKTTSRKGTENETGTGIGLMLCKEFVEKQHGTLELESEEGKGTKVIIRIPSDKRQFVMQTN